MHYVDRNFEHFKPIELVAVLQGLVKLDGEGWLVQEPGLHEMVQRAAQVIATELTRLDRAARGGGEAITSGAVTPQTAASFAWLCARTGVLPAECFARMCDVLAAQLPGLKTVEVLNIAWACAKLGFKHDPLLKTLVEDMYGRARTLSVRDTCQVAWVLATLNVQNAGAFRLLAQHANAQLGEM